MSDDEGDGDPLLEWLGEPEEEEEALEELARNDEWAFRKADRLVDRIPRRVGKDRRTEGEVFDRTTLLTLHKLLRSGVLRSLDFPVSTGKEANVFRGTTPQGDLAAVKIYRINTATFKHVLKYIQGDERFQGATGDKKSMVYAWAQKEFRNLLRMRKAGVDVPEPWQVLHNVLVTEYLGVPEGPWPTMKEYGALEDPELFWDKLVDDYLRTTNKAGLVHADLSEFNVLVQDADAPWPASAAAGGHGPGRDAGGGAQATSGGGTQATTGAMPTADVDTAPGAADRGARAPTPVRAPVPRLIDVGQAVLLTHPMANEFLERDLRNLERYFHRQGLTSADADEIRQRVQWEKEVDLE